ncbi:UNVERIFIED_CONTAM: 60S ribosomal protein L27-3 [Sesamum angustifolium]|uniref:60S ribosomal protein L27-3 n=1 Tax=Sesamum angustifolium TaxID=2727405 RepID=A0AAW2ILN9_9LAMI
MSGISTDGTRDRPYGHCLVAGVAKYPSKVIRKDSAKKQAKKSRVKAFIKLVNYNHIMPTRYTLDVDLKDVVSADALVSRDKKVTACKRSSKFEDRFKTGKNVFLELRFEVKSYDDVFLIYLYIVSSAFWFASSLFTLPELFFVVSSDLAFVPNGLLQ